MKLTSTSNITSCAPQVIVKINAPPNTSTVRATTNGPKAQNVSFTSEDKKITWNIQNFPGGSYAQAFIRVTNILFFSFKICKYFLW